MDQHELIAIRQLPIIEDRLQMVKESVAARVAEATSLVCTEDTYKDVKKVRATLSKEYQEMEARRKEVKAEVLAPYENFERVYKECVGDAYTAADRVLKGKIAEVEDGLKAQKIETLQEYFSEYRESLGIASDFVHLQDMGLRVGLSDSLIALKKKAAEYLDRIASDLKAIDLDANRDELLIEYRKNYDLAGAMAIVSRRHQQMEEARKAREAAEARKQADAAKQAEVLAAAQETAAKVENPEALAAPSVTEAPAEKPAEAPQMYTTKFTVTGTLEQLKALKKFLIDGGYYYE